MIPKIFGLLAAVAIATAACSSAATPAATGAPSSAATGAPSSAATGAPSSAATGAPSSAATSAPTAGATSGGASAGGGASTGTLTVARFADWYNFFHPVEFQTGNQFQWWNCLFNTLVNVDADIDDDHAQPGGHVGRRPPTPRPTRSTCTRASSGRTATPFTAQDVIYSATWYAQNPGLLQGLRPGLGPDRGCGGHQGHDERR